MPTKQYNVIYNDVSKEDFDNKFAYIRDMDEKFDFIVSYILSYGYNFKPDNLEFEDLVDHVRMRFIESSVHKKQEYEFLEKNAKKVDASTINPYDKGKNHDKELLEKEFLSNPLKFIKKHGKELAEKISVDNKEKDNWLKHCKDLYHGALNLEDDYNEVEKINRVNNMKKKLCEKSGFIGDIDLNNMLSNYKGGFFERMFRTTSEEYRVFKATLLAFNDEDSKGYGDIDNLEGATRAYLYHGKELAEKISVDNKEKDNWLKHCKDLYHGALNLEDDYNEVEKINRVNNMKKKLCEKSGFIGDIDLNNMLSNYKGGFFERMFRTTSEEYRVFKATLLAFNDEDSKGYGDIDNLEGATRAYLYHKLPNFKETDELPKDEDIRNLSGTSKRRVELCINVLKAVQEQRRQDEMSIAFKNMNLFSDIKDQDEEVLEFLKDDVNLDFVKKIDEIRKYNPDNKGNNLIDENENLFQKDLNKNLDENSSNLINNMDDESFDEFDVNNDSPLNK